MSGNGWYRRFVRDNQQVWKNLGRENQIWVIIAMTAIPAAVVILCGMVAGAW